MIIQNAASRKGRVSTRRTGFSLVEILVVLVILLIGILTILRLFPGGFLTIKRTGELTSAEALANQSLTRIKEAGGTFDSVLAVDGSGAPDLTARPDDMSDVLDSNGIPDWSRSNVNRFLLVLGEVLRIPVPTANAATGGYGATAVLKFGPVRNRLFVTVAGPADLIDVSGAPLERVQTSSDGTFDQRVITPVLREGQYAIDYRRRRIAFFPRRANGRANAVRRFLIAYEYQARVGTQIVLRSSLAGEIGVPDQNIPQIQEIRPLWQPILNDPADVAITGEGVSNAMHPRRSSGAAPPIDITYGSAAYPTTGIRPESVSVSRAFRLLSEIPVSVSGAAPAWSDDPYEYVWYSPQIIADGGTDVNANLGVLLFNPRGYTTASSGGRPFAARVNYQIFDNHIIRDERQIPTNAPYTVRLALNNILQNGDGLNDDSAYNGMFRGSQPTTVVGRTPDIIIVNANTGQTLAEIAANNCTQYNNQDAFALDAKNGTIRFARNFIENGGLQNATIKVLYRAQGDWGVQIQKAHNLYVQSDVPTTVDPGNSRRPMDYSSYYVGGTVPNAGSPTRVYFPVTETGKTIVLGDVYGVDSNGNTLHYSNDAYKTQIYTGAPIDPNPIPMCYIDIQEKHPTLVALSAARTGRAVTNVHGGSVTARVAWRNGTRWRKLDSETFLSGIRL